MYQKTKTQYEKKMKNKKEMRSNIQMPHTRVNKEKEEDEKKNKEFV